MESRSGRPSGVGINHYETSWLFPSAQASRCINEKLLFRWAIFCRFILVLISQTHSTDTYSLKGILHPKNAGGQQTLTTWNGFNSPLEIFLLTVLCKRLSYQSLTRINTAFVVSVSIRCLTMALCCIQTSSNHWHYACFESAISFPVTFHYNLESCKAKWAHVCFIIPLSPPCGSFQEAWQADGFPASLHEIQTQQAEAEAEGHPEGAGLRLRPGRAPSQLWTRRYRDTQASNITLRLLRLLYLDLFEILVPQVLKSCSEFIEKHGIVDGIYRHSGISSNIQKLRWVCLSSTQLNSWQKCYCFISYFADNILWHHCCKKTKVYFIEMFL